MAEEWLLIEWPKGEEEPTKYWLSTLPDRHDSPSLVDTAKLRWRIERDYQELKQEIGLGHTKAEAGEASTTTPGSASPPTDSWSPRGRRFPPQDLVPPGVLKKPALPEGYRPRGSPDPTRTARPKLDRNNAATTERHARQTTEAMSVLHGVDVSRALL